jgi:hypothetical protein
MAASSPARRPASYEDLLQVPDHLVAEILDGGLRHVGAHPFAISMDRSPASSQRLTVAAYASSRE